MRPSVLLATILMLAVVLSPTVLAQDTEAYHMVITYTDGDHDVGDDLDVTVHVFEKGKYVSVDNVTLDAGSSGTKEVELTETATGKWTGTFTIEESDFTDFGFTRYLPLYADAEINGSTVKTAENAIYKYDMSTDESLIITTSLDPPSVYMGPGETKEITWEVRRGGTLVDPTDIEATKYEGSGDEPIELTRSSTGVYTYSYTMPNGPRSMRAEFDVMATLESGTDIVDGDSDLDLFLNFFHVWAKKDAVSATSASFDLFVANGTGAAVEAASVNLDYDYHNDDADYIQKSTNGTTDADGRASIDFPYNDLGDTETEVYISGKVTAQGKEQTLEFTLQVRAPTDEPEEPEPFGFDVVPEKDMFDFDKDVNLPATAYYDEEPLSTNTVYWYAYTDHAVLNKGEKTTSAVGEFSVDFRTPNKGASSSSFPLYTHYQAPIEDGGTLYHEDTEWSIVTSLAGMMEPDSVFDALRQYKDNAVKVSVGKLEKNKDVPVTITYSGADEEWMVAVMLGNDPNPGNMGLVPTWTYWTEGLWEGAYGDMASLDGNDWETSVFVPENLPNKDFYVGGLCVDQNFMAGAISGDLTELIKTNYVDGLEIGQSGTSGGDGGDGLVDRLMEDFLFGIPLLYWIFILIIIVILGVVVGLFTTRKREPAGLEEPGLEPSEGPTFDGGPGAAAMPMPATSYEQMQPVPGQADYGAPPPPPPEYGAPPPAEYAAPPPPAPAPQPEYGAPAAPPPAEYAAPPPQEYAAPPPPAPAPQPEYAAPAAPPPAEYAAPPPPAPAPQPEYAAPPPPAPAPQPEYAAPPPPAPAPQPGYAAPAAPPPAPAPQPGYAAPAAPPAPAPVAPEVPPPAPETPPPAAAPPPAAVPAPAAPAPPAADPGATMTIRCQKCQTTLTIPRKRPIKVTCPNCGASGVLR